MLCQPLALLLDVICQVALHKPHGFGNI